MTEQRESGLTLETEKKVGAVVFGLLTLITAAWWVAVALFLVSVGVWGIVAWPLAVWGIIRVLAKGVTAYRKIGKDERPEVVVNVSNGITEEQIAQQIRDGLAFQR